jgi:hypothetical protein
VLLVGVGVRHEVDVADGLAEHGVAVGNLVPGVNLMVLKNRPKINLSLTVEMNTLNSLKE